jgi:hypothetical protein
MQLRDAGDDGGVDCMLLAQIVAAGVAVVAAAGYAVTRRLAPSRR